MNIAAVREFEELHSVCTCAFSFSLHWFQVEHRIHNIAVDGEGANAQNWSVNSCTKMSLQTYSIDEPQFAAKKISQPNATLALENVLWHC